MPSSYKIRMLTGQWAGRELNLPEGSVQMGAEEQADLYAVFPQGEGRSIHLHIDAGGIHLQANMLPVWLQGRALPPSKEPYVLPLQQAIDVAGFVFVIAPSTDKITVHKPPVRIAPKNMRQKLILSSLMTVLFGLLGGIGLLLLFEVEYEPPKALNVFEIIEQAKQTDALKNLTFTQTQTGAYRITGHCEQSKDLNILLLRLRTRSVAFHDDVVCRDTLLRNVYSALRLNGFDSVEVFQGDEPGTVILQGNIVDSRRWAVVTQLLGQIEGLLSWRVKNAAQADMQAFIQQLKHNKLLRHLSVVQQDKTVVLTGELSELQEASLNTILKTYQSQNAQLRFIYQNIPAMHYLPGILPASIISYGGNLDNLFIELENGMRAREGTTFASGYEIIAITQSGVQLQKQNELVYLPINF